jgi:hypothetical protein
VCCWNTALGPGGTKCPMKGAVKKKLLLRRLRKHISLQPAPLHCIALTPKGDGSSQLLFYRFSWFVENPVPREQ